MAWKHAHGFYGCDLKAPYYSQTSAEPAAEEECCFVSPDGFTCRAYAGHFGQHSDGNGHVWPTVAEPAASPVVISSPAHFLPEVKSRAQAFAEAYRELHDLSFSVVSHLEWAYLMGQQDERLKGGVR